MTVDAPCCPSITAGSKKYVLLSTAVVNKSFKGLITERRFSSRLEISDPAETSVLRIGCNVAIHRGTITPAPTSAFYAAMVSVKPAQVIGVGRAIIRRASRPCRIALSPAVCFKIVTVSSLASITVLLPRFAAMPRIVYSRWDFCDSIRVDAFSARFASFNFPIGMVVAFLSEVAAGCFLPHGGQP